MEKLAIETRKFFLQAEMNEKNLIRTGQDF